MAVLVAANLTQCKSFLKQTIEYVQSNTELGHVIRLLLHDPLYHSPFGRVGCWGVVDSTQPPDIVANFHDIDIVLLIVMCQYYLRQTSDPYAASLVNFQMIRQFYI